MMQQTSRDPEGTMLYVTATGSLYLKVPQGWKEIQVLAQTSKSKTLTRSSCPGLICALLQLSSLIYVSGNIVPQDEVNVAEFGSCLKMMHVGWITYRCNVSFQPQVAHQIRGDTMERISSASGRVSECYRIRTQSKMSTQLCESPCAVVTEVPPLSSSTWWR